MDFAALFLALGVIMTIAWAGWRRVALGLFAVAAVLTLALFRHHATDVLALSF
jgi:hypothetical protein